VADQLIMPNTQSSHAAAQWILFILSAIVGVIAISAQSFWIDEANSAILAIQPTFADFIAAFSRNRGSDLQMPGYMIALWAWEKLSGPSEWGMRLLNVGFFLTAQWALLFGLRAKAGVVLWAALLTLFYPFAWYYLDDARPYLMQFGSATLCVVALVNLRSFPREQSVSKDIAIFLIGLVLLCASSLIGVLLASAFFFVFAATLLTPPCGRWVMAKQARTLLPMVIAAVFLGGLAVFYLWTLTVGARASGASQTTPMTLGFAAYEILGFAGLGPDRNQLRGTGLSALTPFLPMLSMGVIGMLALTYGLIGFVRSANPARIKSIIPILAACALLSAILIAAGYFAGFRILGRHFAPFTPIVILMMAVVVDFLSRRRSTVWMAVVVLLPWLVSDWGLRFSGTFQKDAYREAAAIALRAASENKSVWWAADPSALEFYATTLHGDSPASEIITLANPNAADLKRQQPPDVVILSKPDLYDATGAITAFLTTSPPETRKVLPAFEIVSLTADAPPLDVPAIENPANDVMALPKQPKTNPE
jgi:hypothetical protein